MKTIVPAAGYTTVTAQAFLNTATKVHVCDLLTTTLIDGTVLYSTNADIDINWFRPGTSTHQVYSSGGGNFTFTRSKTSTKIGSVVAEMDLSIMANSSALVGTIPFLKFCKNNGFDGAIIRLDRLFGQFSAGVLAHVGSVNIFLGRVSALTEVTRLKADFKVKSMIVLLDVQLPKNQWQPTCLHTLYDTGCGLNRESFQQVGTVTGGTQLALTTNLTGQPANQYTQGYIIFTSGLNSGMRRTIINYDTATGTIALGLPLTSIPVVGDAFKAYAGCDHTSATCASAKFSNLNNFRGYEFVPVPQTAL